MFCKSHFSGKANAQGISQPVCILMYHAVIQSPLRIPDWCFLDVNVFRMQVKYLKNNFDVVPLSEAVARLEAKAVRRPTAVITFDDGFQNNYDVAFPILREEGLPATIFLTTGLIGTNETLWFCRLNRALTNTTRCSLEWNGCAFDLSGVEAKSRASSLIQARIKDFPHPQLLAELRKIIISLDDDPDCLIEIDSPFRVLSRDQVINMISTRLIEIGAHTHSHAILSLLPTQERKDEIGQSLAAVQELTNRPCEMFAYPNGRVQDYDQESIRILRTLGVHTCVTAIEELNDGATPSMELRRYGIGADLTMKEFEEMMREVRLATSH